MVVEVAGVMVACVDVAAEVVGGSGVLCGGGL